MSAYQRCLKRAAHGIAATITNCYKATSTNPASSNRSVTSLASAACRSLLSQNQAVCHTRAVQAVRSQFGQVFSMQPSFTLPFAASGASAGQESLLSKTGSTVQTRAASSGGDLTEEGDEDGQSTSNSRRKKQPPDGGGGDDGPPHEDDAEAEDSHRFRLSSGLHYEDVESSQLSDLYNIQSKGDAGRSPTLSLRGYERQDNADPLDMLVFAKESFMRKDEKTIPIPPNVREVMYQHRWDKLLVEVNRGKSRDMKGKYDHYTALVAVGNMKGLLGLGTGLANNAQESVAIAYLDAFNKLVHIPIYRNHTIYHHVTHQFHFMTMQMWPRRQGYGIVANDLIMDLCHLVGIKDITVKIWGGRKSKMYGAMCFMEALQKASVPHMGVEGSYTYVKETYSRPQLPFGLARGQHV